MSEVFRKAIEKASAKLTEQRRIQDAILKEEVRKKRVKDDEKDAEEAKRSALDYQSHGENLHAPYDNDALMSMFCTRYVIIAVNSIRSLTSC
jgi:hypothetical protein